MAICETFGMTSSSEGNSVSETLLSLLLVEDSLAAEAWAGTTGLLLETVSSGSLSSGSGESRIKKTRETVRQNYFDSNLPSVRFSLETTSLSDFIQWPSITENP